MKKNIFLLLAASLLGMGHSMADNVLVVKDVDVPQGGQGTIEIGCEFDTEYTAFELQLSLPDGFSLLTDEEGYPVIEKAFSTNHILTGNLLSSNGNYKFTCRSMDNISISTSGALFRVTVQADASLALGTSLTASITTCEFTRTADSEGESLADTEFSIHITESRTILDENSTQMPVAENGAKVRVKRTVNADVWSTICLPFAMTEAQTKEAFGNDVQLADFTGYQATEDDDENVVGITVSFEPVNAIEANHPYIIKVSSPLTEFTVDDVDINPEEEPTKAAVKRTKKQWSEMIGTYVAEKTIEDQMLFLNGGCFWYSTGKTKMKGYRAYFDFYDVLTDVEGADVRIFLDFDGEETGIREILTSDTQRAIFDLSGRKVVKPQLHGVYIINGKKIMK
ncbi:MAG: hypothetical protein J6W52_13315 [Bacteroidaceae bacterium]|nr:hypothetical protein [Bacteroidaceae bacterium]